MFAQLSCVVVDADVANRQEMADFLANYGINLVAQFGAVEQLPPLLGRADAPQLVIINLDPNAHATLKKVGHMPHQYPRVNFFLMSQTVDPHLLMDAMHLGIKEFIPLPISEDKFAAAIERVTHGAGMSRRAKIIHVVPTIGGCGSTTIACNIATSLASRARTVLVDLDLIRGGAASCFDLHPRYTIADVMDSHQKIDVQLLDNALARHAASNLAILARPELPEDTQRVHADGLNRLLGVLSRMFDFVVVDSVMSIDPLYANAIRMADANLLVMQLNIPSAKNAERFVGVLRRMGVEPGKIKIVVNRYVKKGWDIEPSEVERALGLKISWMVPNDWKNAITAMNFGEPVVLRVPRAEMSISLRELADTFCTKDAVAA